MSKQIYPPVLPKSGVLYDDDAAKPAAIDFNHLEASFQLSQLLQQLGHSDAAELARPIHLLNLEPGKMLARLREYAEQSGGIACIALVNRQRLPEFIWSYDCADGANHLVRLKLAGGFILGFMIFRPDGSVECHPENGQDRDLSQAILNVWARGYVMNPKSLAAEEILSLDKPDSFSPTNLETTLNSYSDVCERYPTPDIHAEITGAI